LAASTPATLTPGSTIGIVGGGQLGRMLAMAAGRLGFRTVILDPVPECPAAQMANHHIAAAYDDPQALDELARRCDVITYEFENIPVAAVERLQNNCPVFPDSRALQVSQDRLEEKRFLSGLGIATAPFFPVESSRELVRAAEACNGQGILKTRRFGYDGKGQTRITALEDCAPAFEAMGGRDLIFEGLVEFDLELSAIALRTGDDQIECYDIVCNEHEQGILRRSSVPAPVNAVVTEMAGDIARRILSALDYVGIIGVEFFLCTDNRLFVNEIAPRVHNSGHWTEAACTISQFENHIRAIAGIKPGSTARHSDCEMVNLIGPDISRIGDILAETDSYIHIYGKSEVSEGRKMGHVTYVHPRTIQ
jgi:5-(carboxyamino)imidazole ribonucleotide synthase